MPCTQTLFQSPPPSPKQLDSSTCNPVTFLRFNPAPDLFREVTLTAPAPSAMSLGLWAMKVRRVR
jgi:hypothetical protein